MDQPGSIDARHQSLGRRLLIAGAAVELSGAEQPGEIPEAEASVHLLRVAAVIFDGIGRADDVDMLQPGDGMQKLQLHVERQRGGKPLQIHLISLRAAGLDKDLMPLLIRKAHDLIFDAGAVPRADPLDFPAVERGAVEIFENDAPRLRIRPRDVAGLRIRQRRLCLKGERNHRLIPVLPLQEGKINAPPQHPRRGSRLEPPQHNAEPLQRMSQLGGGEQTVRPALIADVSDKNAATEKGSGGDDDGLGQIDRAEAGGQRPRAVPPRQRHDLRLHQLEMLSPLQGIFHAGGIAAAVDLRPQ